MSRDQHERRGANDHVLAGGPEQRWAERPVTRRVFLLGTLTALTAGRARVNASTFVVNSYQVPLTGLLRPLRVAQLSDLHLGPFIPTALLRRWIDATLAAAPDLIVITGDFVDQTCTWDVTPTLREFRRLRAPLGVWGVLGNHDHQYLRRTRLFGDDAATRNFANLLADVGVRVLHNRSARVRADLHLLGIDDLMTGRPDLRAATEALPAHGAALLLSHNPDVLPEVPERVTFTLSGHTHGGQVRLPLLGALFTSSRYGERFARGMVNAPAAGFVSCGLGVSTLPLRLNCPAELVVLDFVPRPVSGT